MDAPYRITPEIWQEGLSFSEYIETMRSRKGRMIRRSKVIQLSEEERALITLTRTRVHMLVMTEDWCGDSLMVLPILDRIAGASPNIKLSIFPRHTHPEMRASYEARNILAVPVVSLLDADFKEFGTWIERAKPANELVHRYKDEHTELKMLASNTGRTAAEEERLGELHLELLHQMGIWYKEGLQSATVKEIAALLAKAPAPV
jgi:hypothetical protein